MEIKLRVEEAQAEAAAVSAASVEASAIINTLRTRLVSLETSFAGQTQVAFQEKTNDLMESNQQMMDALDGLGQFLNAAAEAIQQVDTDLAAQLNG